MSVNSSASTQAAPIKRLNNCTVCNTPQCDGELNALRHFKDWRDLSDHLDEATIVTFINHLSTIAEEYVELKERSSDAAAKRHAYQQERQMLINYAKSNLSIDELATVRERAERLAANVVAEPETPVIKTVHNGRVKHVTGQVSARQALASIRRVG